MPLAEVKTLYEANARDVPAMLRRLAEDIEAEKYGEMEGLVSVLISHPEGAPKCNVFAFGDLGKSCYDALGVLVIGQKTLSEML